MPEEANSPLQAPFSRRSLLGGAAALAIGTALDAYLPASVRNAMAAAPTAPFDLSQIKHVVLLMQENRSFDHYFGTMSGVRGFSDPHAMKLANGNSVFQQPDPDNPDGYLLPYRLDTTTTGSSAIPSTNHDWRTQHQAWNRGRMDGWIRAHQAADSDSAGEFTMGYYTAEDIPFQHALANAFTICDNCFCSLFGPTHPNRYLWMTGTIDPNGVNGGPALENNAPPGVYTWTTYAERLQAAGISWKCYQQADNYGTNILENFGQLIAAETINPALYNSVFGVSTHLDGTPATDPTRAFEEDCANGTLPTVSWIFPPSTQSEHPSFLPAAGAQFVASKIEAIAANQDLWSSTVFLLTYDENDGLFDHVAPIVAPPGTPDEYVTKTSPGGTPGGGLPVGGGFRVPCIIVSPWTVGGNVYSEALDHTSSLRLLEKVTGVQETNISAWRRGAFGDFTSIFQDVPRPAPSLPEATPAATATVLAKQTTASKLPLPPFPGRTQNAPTQDPGSRPQVG